MNFYEYIDELRLDDKQYRQEEDLYYIFNRMLRESFLDGDITVRDVHIMRKTDSKKVPGRKLFAPFDQKPDLIILNKQFDQTQDVSEGKKHIYGCLEGKKIRGSLSGQLGFLKKRNESKIKVKLHGKITYSFNFTIEKIEEENKKGTKESPKEKGPKITISYIEKDEKNKTNVELLKEICGFPKVILTNGLQWVLLEREKGTTMTQEGDTKYSGKLCVSVKEMCKIPVEILEENCSPEIISKAQNEFIKLCGELQKINWKEIDQSIE